MSAPEPRIPDPERVRELFHAAAELDRDARAELLKGEHPEVREEVDSLLAAHDEAGSFLGKSVWEFIDRNDPQRLTGRTVGPYRILRPVGHGGMGSVFLAVRDDEQFDQRVAIKLVRGGVAGEALVRRFRQERQILAALEHPNIARLLDGGTTADGLPYLVMEYVDGVPIDEYSRGLSTEQKLRLFLQLCDGVEHAHRSLVIHRDLKPGNVLVTRDGVPKLLDFGIAKLTSEEIPGATVTRLMTPDYASPEQLLGQPVTTATDVYSLGVLLYEILTGAPAFRSADRLPNTEPARPSTVARAHALRGDLDNIVMMAMEIEPARRYGSVEKLADDVRRYLGGLPVAARRATFFYRSSKFVRRNKLAVAAGIAIVAITAIAFVATLRQKRIAERRFEQVRSLARSVVFELHDAIATLPGSTGARELLVARALVYLDHLAADAADNTPLQIELAGAYLKIGDVQGLPYSANLGDTAGAMKSYAKAQSIAEAICAREPENEQGAMLLADARDRGGFVAQRALDWAKAYREHDAARAIRERLPNRGIAGDLLQARTLVAIGDCVLIGHKVVPPEARKRTPQQWYLDALALLGRVPPQGPHRAERLREIARAHQHLGGVYTHTPRDMRRALMHHDAALQAMEQVMVLSPADSAAKRNFADQLVMKATAQNAMRDGDGALAGTRRALPVLLELAAGDPRNKEAQHDLAFVYEQMALALLHLRRWEEGERAAREVLAIRERLIAADPTNREDRRDMSRTYSVLSEAARGRGDRAAAEALARKSSEIYQATR